MQQPALERDAPQGDLEQQLEEAEQQQLDEAEPPGRLGPRTPGARVHICIACDAPVAVYGHLLPCMHTYCLACATDMPACFVCGNPIHMVRRIEPPQAVFISSVTMQGFASELAMARHTARLHQHIMVHQAAELQGAKAQMQAAQQLKQEQQPQLRR